MGDMWISDISHFDLPDTRLPDGQGGRKIRFLGEIVSAASVMVPGEFQVSAVRCRRRPKRHPCAGHIRLGRDLVTDEIHWACTGCSDRGVIKNWRTTRWDLGRELQHGHVISLAEERARRAMRAAAPAPLKVYELDVELVYAPVMLEERVYRRIRLSGDHTLHDLHTIIHQAFDRVEDEAYEFMFGPAYDPETRRFSGGSEEREDTRSETRAAHLDLLKLRPGDSFGYLFDFAEEWVHRVTVSAVKEMMTPSVPPRVVSRLGESPPPLVVDHDFEDELFVDVAEPACPLSGIYGPYRAEDGVNAEDWLALDDLERHFLVIEAHTRSLPDWHPPMDSVLLHAVIHVVAETHLSRMKPRHAQAALQPYSSAGGSRHSGIHRLGDRLVRDQMDVHKAQGHVHRRRH